MAWPVSARFLKAISESHTVTARAEVLDAGEVVATLDVRDGSVSMERERANRRTGNVTIVDAEGDLTPAEASDLLAPFGTEIALYRGVDFKPETPGTDVEWVPLGVFGFRETAVRDGDDGVSITCSLVDRSARVQSAKWEDWNKVALDIEISTAIIARLQDRYPQVEFDLPTTEYFTQRAFLAPGEESDPWRDLQEMAAAAGETLAFGPDGVVRYDVASTAPVRTYRNGPKASIIDLERTWSTEAAFNVVIATGESSSQVNPVRWSAEDIDPNSPTYVDGKFGRRPTFIKSPHIRNNAQAETAAYRELELRRGGAATLTWTALVDPSLDVVDTIQVERPESGTSALVAIDSLTIPLSAQGSQSGSGRIIGVAGQQADLAALMGG